MSTVFIALQTNEDTRQIIEAIQLDNLAQLSGGFS